MQHLDHQRKPIAKHSCNTKWVADATGDCPPREARIYRLNRLCVILRFCRVLAVPSARWSNTRHDVDEWRKAQIKYLFAKGGAAVDTTSCDEEALA